MAPSTPHRRGHRRRHSGPTRRQSGRRWQHRRRRRGDSPRRRRSPPSRRPAWRLRLSRWDMQVSPYLFIAPFFVLFAVFGLFPLGYTLWVSLHDWSLLGEHTWSGLGQLHAQLMADRASGTRSSTRSASSSLATVPQLLLALLLANLLNRRLRGRTFFRMGVLLPEHHLGGRGRHRLQPALQPRLRPDQLGARPGRHRPDRLAGHQVVVLDRDLHDGRLAVDRLQRAHLPGRHAGDPARPLRGGRVDGASAWRQFWSITVPMLRPTIDLHGHHLHDRRPPAVHRAAAVQLRRRTRCAAAPCGSPRP